MKSTVILIFSVITIATGYNSEYHPEHPSVSKHDEKHHDSYTRVLWDVAKYKSIMQGIGEGFYDDVKYLQNDECLNLEAVEAIDNLLEGYNHGVNILDKTLRAATAGLVFYNSV